MRIDELKSHNLVLDEESLLELSSVWTANVQRKMKLFRWRFILNSSTTIRELCNRGMAHLLSVNLCLLCDLMEASIEHLFFE